MKKLISVLLLVAMLLSLVGCGGGDAEKQEGAGIDALVADYGFQWTDTSAPIVNEKDAEELSFTIYSSKNASALDYNKALALLLSLVMVLSLAACGSGENTAPKITGVMDQTIEAGSEFSALEGVTASDAEDGDITSKISVTATPELTFKNGKATPEQAGSYELVYSVTDKGGEALLESATLFHEARANFNGLAASAGEDTVVSCVFTAEANVSDPVIRLQIGNPSDGAANNTILIDDVQFGLVEGDKEVNKTIYAFNAFGPNTANATNADYPWQTFNGTDEDNDRGVGTIWTENGSLFYRIDQGGVTDWHNKLICGYGDNPLVLASDSYYIVEITAKATKDVSCSFFLNPLGGWDPRISEGMDITTEEQTFTFETTDIFITDMNFEMLFQFGSEATAALGEVTVEICDITIYQKTVN